MKHIHKLIAKKEALDKQYEDIQRKRRDITKAIEAAMCDKVYKSRS